MFIALFRGVHSFFWSQAQGKAGCVYFEVLSWGRFPLLPAGVAVVPCHRALCLEGAAASLHPLFLTPHGSQPELTRGS
jgi:hypothetical protein